MGHRDGVLLGGGCIGMVSFIGLMSCGVRVVGLDLGGVHRVS